MQIQKEDDGEEGSVGRLASPQDDIMLLSASCRHRFFHLENDRTARLLHA